MKRQVLDAIKTAIRFELEGGMDRDNLKDAIIDDLTYQGINDLEGIDEKIEQILGRLADSIR